MSNRYDDIFEEIREHCAAINKSFLFYRPVAKMQKLNVLNAASKYLSGKMSKDELNKIIDKNSHYGDALGSSKTKLLINLVLKQKPFHNRTKEGYIYCKP